ncbi:MAG: hypothetical protein WAK18_11665 [Nocardioidaceae bacterium]
MSGGPAKPRDFEREQRRKRLLLGVGLLVVLLAVIAYFAFRSDGEDTRAAYCTKLKAFDTESGLEQTLRKAKRPQLDAITAVAPRAVKTAWSNASSFVLLKNPTSTELSIGEPKLTSDVNVIVADAADNCSMRIAR